MHPHDVVYIVLIFRESELIHTFCCNFSPTNLRFWVISASLCILIGKWTDGNSNRHSQHIFNPSLYRHYNWKLCLCHCFTTEQWHFQHSMTGHICLLCCSTCLVVMTMHWWDLCLKFNRMKIQKNSNIRLIIKMNELQSTLIVTVNNGHYSFCR